MTDFAVRQLRVVLVVADLEAAVRYYRDTLGLGETGAFAGPEGAQVVILEAGRATLELANPAQARFIAALQIGYLLVGIRAAGLAAGPMAGFDPAGVDAEFFPEGRFKSLAVVNLGHPGEKPWRDRLPRLSAETTVQWA